MELPVEVRIFHGVVMREVMGRLSATIQQHHLTPAQVSALFRIRLAGSMTVSAIGAELGLTSGPTSHLVELLVRRGLVRRVEDTGDRRRRHVELTPDGATFLDNFDSGLDRALAALLAPVPAPAVADLAAALRAVLPHLQGPDP